MRDSEVRILKHHQSKCFPLEVAAISSTKAVSSKSRIANVHPFVDDEGVLQVSGRTSKGDFDHAIKHPIIVSRKSQLHLLIARWYHQQTNHCGRGINLNTVRSAGYWIVRCTAVVKNLIFRCVTCKKLRCSPIYQQMADLPEDRLQQAAPFTYSGVEPFLGGRTLVRTLQHQGRS